MANNCPKCGNVINTNLNYDCLFCGEKFWQSKESFEKHLKTIDPLIPENDKSKKSIDRTEDNTIIIKKKTDEIYCAKCGKPNEDDAKYCIYCGERLILKKHTEEIEIKVQPTSSSKRALNLILDTFGYYLWAIIIGFCLGSIGLSGFINDNTSYIFGILAIFSYFLFFESFFSKSPAKFLTRTKVITTDGLKPTFKTIVVRTLCRFIPFDLFSFFGNKPIGWHDKFSKTLVIDN